ncbi:hypothetical protein EB354_04375 [Chryseobacterium balustinum]|uniref:Uncharacterized protein n=1 Tax=Chryseobacterium balustinum TaxID=246 RepID=A0AAX2IER3_9FLAO|nr:hypothetical protein EB354_04375 [Chryseobacterium balustinum]SKB77253.1 hypothetical protein SAMN05421800_10855 [Chryseobacterium balustinum]SQA86608.1 Uncharacterised protein [Chryseobacterium balustinum]
MFIYNCRDLFNLKNHVFQNIFLILKRIFNRLINLNLKLEIMKSILESLNMKKFLTQRFILKIYILRKQRQINLLRKP